MELDVDFEIEQMIKINNFLHKIAYLIKIKYNLKDSSVCDNKMFHITINWFIYQLSMKTMHTKYLLNDMKKFDYKNFILDIYYYCKKIDDTTIIDDIEYIFNTNISTFIETEYHFIKEHLIKYISIPIDNIILSEISNFTYELKLKINKKYKYAKYQKNISPFVVKINDKLYNKLSNQITENIKDKNYLIFVLITRYKIYDIDLIGNSLAINSVYQNIPDNSLELFASPVNCHLKNYCSIFPDIEIYFGSIGNAFTYENDMFFWKKFKYIICNPPYCIQIMIKMSEMILKIIEYCIVINHNITFIINVPDWRYGESFFGEYEVYNILKKHIKKENVFDGSYKYFDYFNYKLVSLNTTNTLQFVVSTT